MNNVGDSFGTKTMNRITFSKTKYTHIHTNEGWKISTITQFRGKASHVCRKIPRSDMSRLIARAFAYKFISCVPLTQYFRFFSSIFIRRPFFFFSVVIRCDSGGFSFSRKTDNFGERFWKICGGASTRRL